MASIPILNIGGDSSEEDEPTTNDQMISRTPAGSGIQLNAHQHTRNNKNSDDFMGDEATGDYESSGYAGGNNANTNTAGQPSIILFRNEDDEEEEYDEPISSAVAENFTQLQVTASPEFIDALQTVETNPNDVNAWNVYLAEIKRNNHGNLTLSDAYKPFFQIFPRAYWVYCDYITACLEKNLYSEAEEVFTKIVFKKSRNIQLWIMYTNYLKSIKYPDRIGKSLDDYINERKLIESAYEQSIDDVGGSFNSYPLWREYIDYVSSWPESGVYSDIGKKRLTLRKVYQKAVNTPIDNLDDLWKEYEAFEKQTGEQLAEKILPEFQEKYLHAKTIYQDRKRHTAAIDFNRLATQPMKELREIQQLEYWNKWIKFELSNPDNLSKTALNATLRMIYDQCISCFLRHPEIWINLANFELESSGPSEARAIFREAIEHIPKIVMLRLAFAEFEEKLGNNDAVYDILMKAFHQIPCGFTFSVLQRFIRRREGVSAARKLFSETYLLRQDKALAFEISLAHAQLELDSNADPKVALKALQLAHSYHPSGGPNMKYVNLHIRTLMRLGDINQIQWIVNNAINEVRAIIQSYYDVSSSMEASENTSGNGVKSSLDQAKSKLPEGFDLLVALRDLLSLYEDYLHAEVVMGLSDSNHITLIREKRDKAKSEYEEYALMKSKRSLTADDLNERYRGTGLFQLPYELSEKYNLAATNLPMNDENLKERSHGKLLLESLTRQDIERKLLKIESQRLGGKSNTEKISSDIANSAELSTVPYLLREFLVQLPSHTGPLPDIDMCLRSLKNTVLPARPESDDNIEVGSKRPRDNDSSINITSGSATEVEEILMKPEGYSFRYDDIFRQRQKARHLG